VWAWDETAADVVDEAERLGLRELDLAGRPRAETSYAGQKPADEQIARTVSGSPRYRA
jgi:hypothetical protein